MASLRLYPGITSAVLENFLRPPLEGLVLETYGSGNGPERADLLAVLREASARGVLILNVTQCPRGKVRGDYQVGRAQAEAGVIAGSDLTSEAAMANLAFVNLSRNDRRHFGTPRVRAGTMQPCLAARWQRIQTDERGAPPADETEPMKEMTMNRRSLTALALAASLVASAASAALLSRGGDAVPAVPVPAFTGEPSLWLAELPVDQAIAAAGRDCPC